MNYLGLPPKLAAALIGAIRLYGFLVIWRCGFRWSLKEDKVGQGSVRLSNSVYVKCESVKCGTLAGRIFILNWYERGRCQLTSSFDIEEGLANGLRRIIELCSYG